MRWYSAIMNDGRDVPVDRLSDAEIVGFLASDLEVAPTATLAGVREQLRIEQFIRAAGLREGGTRG